MHKILVLTSGERIIGDIEENGLFWKITDPFSLQESFMDSEFDQSMVSQLTLICFTAYSNSNVITLPKQHVMVIMDPNELMLEMYNEEVKFFKETNFKTKEKPKGPSDGTGGTATQFKKRN